MKGSGGHVGRQMLLARDLWRLVRHVEERRKKLLMGNINPEDREESELKPKEWPKHLPEKVYKSRTEFMISKLEAGD